MKAFLLALLAGAIAGLVGLIISYVTEYRLLTWTITGTLIATAIKINDPDRKNWYWWAILGGTVICCGYLIGRLILFPLVAWYIFGAIFMALCSPKRVMSKILSGLIGFGVGILGMGIIQIFIMGLIPLMGFSSFFSYDIEGLGIVMTGILMTTTAFFIRRWGNKSSRE